MRAYILLTFQQVLDATSGCVPSVDAVIGHRKSTIMLPELEKDWRASPAHLRDALVLVRHRGTARGKVLNPGAHLVEVFFLKSKPVHSEKFS